MSLSLRDKLVLAFLGLLLFSFALTGAIFWLRVQSYTEELNVSQLRVASSLLRLQIQYAIGDPARAINTLQSQVRPHLRFFPGVELLITDQNDRVIYASVAPAPVTMLPVPYPPLASGVLGSPEPFRISPCFVSHNQTFDCVAQSAQHQTLRYYSYTPSSLHFNNAIFAQSRTSLQARATQELLGQMVWAVAAASAVALLIAPLLVRYITRPLLRMTAASEAMAAGDYDQHVLTSSGDEVGVLARSFNRMAYEVQRARQTQREFVANISHDLKTPLTSIIGFSQILADGSADTRLSQRAVQVINQEARRMKRLTEELLDLARLEAGQVPLRRQPINLTVLLADVFNRYATLCPRSDIEMRDLHAPEPLELLGDPDRLTQVIVNLLDNAIKFCRPEGFVELTSGIANGQAQVAITNSAEGLAPDETERIFDRFYRTDHARARVEGGTGLGLAIVREIVAAHGGHVHAESVRGAYVRFVVRLPLAHDASAPSGQP